MAMGRVAAFTCDLLDDGVKLESSPSAEGVSVGSASPNTPTVRKQVAFLDSPAPLVSSDPTRSSSSTPDLPLGAPVISMTAPTPRQEGSLPSPPFAVSPPLTRRRGSFIDDYAEKVVEVAGTPTSGPAKSPTELLSLCDVLAQMAELRGDMAKVTQEKEVAEKELESTRDTISNIEALYAELTQQMVKYFESNGRKYLEWAQSEVEMLLRRLEVELFVSSSSSLQKDDTESLVKGLEDWYEKAKRDADDALRASVEVGAEKRRLKEQLTKAEAKIASLETDLLLAQREIRVLSHTPRELTHEFTIQQLEERLANAESRTATAEAAASRLRDELEVVREQCSLQMQQLAENRIEVHLPRTPTPDALLKTVVRKKDVATQCWGRRLSSHSSSESSEMWTPPDDGFVVLVNQTNLAGNTSFQVKALTDVPSSGAPAHNHPTLPHNGVPSKGSAVGSACETSCGPSSHVQDMPSGRVRGKLNTPNDSQDGTLSALLRRVNLTEFVPVLQGAGYHTPRSLVLLNDERLAKLGLKRAQRMRLLEGLAQVTGRKRS